MTDAERKALNKRVARKRGWIVQERGTWFHLPTVLFRKDPPDFTREWEYAGPLFVELCANKGRHYAWYLVLEMADRFMCTLTEAITRTFDAWKEGEEE